MPLSGGEVLAPTLITTVPFGTGLGELSPHDGEHLVNVALTPDFMAVFEHQSPKITDPLPLLTGRVLLLDRSGTWIRDEVLPDLAESSIVWSGTAPNGTLFITLWLADGTSRLDAYTVSDEGLRLLQSSTLDSGPQRVFEIVTGGVDQPGSGRVMDIETNVALDETSVEAVKRVDGGRATVTVDRSDLLGSTQWIVNVEQDDSDGGAPELQRFGPFGDGAWFADVTVRDVATFDPFVAVLPADSSPHWFRLGEWRLQASDNRMILFTHATPAGIEIAALMAKD
ncbi:MAG: hypothetical protein H6514_16045 [Acidimicrobiaceae bacterium]|nr:hypothetical protein [Acidimicrobiaceae bacterium]